MDSDVKYYPLGEEMYADMLRALESAEHFIFLEYFIIQPGKMWDGIAEILKRKAAQGVDVRLICCLLYTPPAARRASRSAPAG